MEEKTPGVNYPLIVTLEIDAPHQSMFNTLRKAHFPAHSNYLEAHITLFHHLPSRETAVPAILRSLSGREPFPLDVTGIKSTGNGVLFTLSSAELTVIHEALQQRFMPWLKRRDQQPLRPHITIQNKVTAFKASRLAETLNASFKPFTITGTGFSTWHYLGGPWRRVGYIPFSYNSIR